MRKGVFYFSAAPVTRQAYKVQQRFSSGKVAMDLLTDAYAASLVLGAVLLWLGVAPALPVVSQQRKSCHLEGRAALDVRPNVRWLVNTALHRPLRPM